VRRLARTADRTIFRYAGVLFIPVPPNGPGDRCNECRVSDEMDENAARRPAGGPVIARPDRGKCRRIAARVPGRPVAAGSRPSSAPRRQRRRAAANTTLTP
jgi:hypothetical protein